MVRSILVTATYSIRHWSNPHVALRQIARTLTPQGLLGLADAFPPARRRRAAGCPGSGSPGALPPAVAQALGAARLRLIGVATVGGFGAITDMTVVVAARHGAGYAPDSRPLTRRRDIPG